MCLSGDLSLEAGAVIDFELDTPWTSDEISMSGNLLLDGQQFSDFNFTPLVGFGPGTYTLIGADRSTAFWAEHQWRRRRLRGNAGRARQR